MGEVWIAAVATVGSAYMSSRSASKGSKDQIKADKEAASRAAYEDRRTMLYGSQLEDAQNQIGKQRRLNARAGHAGVRGKLPPVLGTEMPAIPEEYKEPAKEPSKKKKEGFLKKASGLGKLKKLF